jgi:hypothetical protein
MRIAATPEHWVPDVHLGHQSIRLSGLLELCIEELPVCNTIFKKKDGDIWVSVRVRFQRILFVYNCRLHRLNGGQEVGQHVPGIARVAAVEELSGVCAHIDAGIFKRIRCHGFA